MSSATPSMSWNLGFRGGVTLVLGKLGGGPVRRSNGKCRLKEDGPRSVWLVQRPGHALRTVKTWPLGLVTLALLRLGRLEDTDS